MLAASRRRPQDIGVPAILDATSVVDPSGALRIDADPLEGIQMMGAYGTTLGCDMERQLRDSLVGTVMGGTSEIQREIIGRGLGL